MPTFDTSRQLWRAATIGLLSCVCAAAAPAQFGSNLITNPGAEAGAGSASGNDVLAIPGWTTTGNFTVVQYGAPAFLTATDPGPAARGANFFSGGPDNASSGARQLIDLAGFAGLGAAVDAGLVRYDLSGWFGGFAGQDDNLTLTATFLNGSSALVGSTTIGGVTAADRASATQLLLRATSGLLPIGTRSVRLDLLSTRAAGAYDDGYGDNLSLVLSATAVAVPEPATVALLGSALPLLGLASLARRRSRER